MHFDGSLLSFVALALASTPQGSKGVSIKIGGINPNAAATYNPATNTFNFTSVNYGLLPFERMTILHECIHVSRDSFGSTVPTRMDPVTTRAVSEEAAAYIGEALFFLEDQGPVSASDTTPSWASSGVYSNALSMALDIRNSQNPKGCNVNDFFPTNFEALKQVILSTAVYNHLKANPNETYDNNGVRL